MAGIVGAVLLPVALVGTFAATLVHVHRQATTQATQTMRACSSRGDAPACQAALGIEIDAGAVAAVQSALAAMERARGEFRSLDARHLCSSTSGGQSWRELRADVEWSAGHEVMVFRWQEVGERWRLTTIAPAPTVPRLCD